MSGLFSGAKTNAAQQTTYSGINVQTSVYGAVAQVVYGANRVAGNLIWYGDFVQISGSGSKGGGKGGGSSGGKAGGNSSQNTYQAAVAIALSEGPIAGIGNAWSDKSETTPGALGFGWLDGTYPQSPWTYLSSDHPDQALGYPGVAHAVTAAIQLGQSAQLPNLTFEVRGRFYGTAPNGVDADPSLVVSDILTNPAYGAGFPAGRIGSLSTETERHTIPAAPGPYTVTVGNASAFQWNLAVEDATGTLYTAVAANPGPLQYSYAAGIYTFNAANAGAQVTISYAALGTLSTWRSYCFAAGLWVSPAYSSQQQTSSVLDDFATFTNSEWVWSSGVLTMVPRGAVALSANGASYTPPAAALFDLGDDDFLPDSGASGASAATNGDPVLLTRLRASDQINDVKLEAVDRANQYNSAVVEVTDQAMIDRYGRRANQSQQAHLFADLGAANVSAQLQLQLQYIRNTYQFSLDQRYSVLDPMDLVTLTDEALGLDRQPVRITEITEQDDGTLAIVAEEYPAGLGAAALYDFETGSAGYRADYKADPGNVNEPVIFEPPDVLGGGLVIWMALSGGSLWGGAQVWVSYDGNSYTLLDSVDRRSVTGTLVAPLPSVPAAATGATIDAADTLEVDVSSSEGALLSATQADALALNSLCYVDGELIAYQGAALVSGGAYALTYLVRGAHGTPIGAHAAGTSFAKLDGSVFRLPYTQDRIGQTIYIKLPSFNIWGGGLQQLADVAPYAYTITGAALASPLPDIANLTSSYIASITYLTWDEVEDFRPVLYEIRKGTNWTGAQVLGRVAHPPFAAQGDGTYWVAAYSQPAAGIEVYSETPSDVSIQGAVIVSNVIATWDEKATGWSGTFGGACGVGGGNVEGFGIGNILSIADFLGTVDILHFGGIGSGTYEIPASHQIDVGRAVPCLVAVSWLSLGEIVGQNLLSIGDFLGTTDILGYAASANTDIYPEIALSQDGTSWGAWQKWAPGSYTARKFKARMQIVTNDPQTIPILESFVISVDVPDREDHYVGLSVPATGLSLSFKPDGAASPAPFNGGPGGAAVPAIQVTIVNAQQGDTYQLTGETLSGCSLKVINGGVGVARTVNLLAQGY